MATSIMSFRFKFRVAILFLFIWRDSVALTTDKNDITIIEEMLHIIEQEKISDPAHKADLATEEGLQISEPEPPDLQDVPVANSSFQNVLGGPGHLDRIKGAPSNATVEDNSAECSNSARVRVENPQHSGVARVNSKLSTITTTQRYDQVDSDKDSDPMEQSSATFDGNSVALTTDKNDITIEEILHIIEQEKISDPAHKADLTTEEGLQISEPEPPDLQGVPVANSRFQDVLGSRGHLDRIKGRQSPFDIDPTDIQVFSPRSFSFPDLLHAPGFSNKIHPSSPSNASTVTAGSEWMERVNDREGDDSVPAMETIMVQPGYDGAFELNPQSFSVAPSYNAGEPHATMQEQQADTIDRSALHPALARLPFIMRSHRDYMYNGTMTGQDPEEELEQQAENSFPNSSIFRRWNEFFGQDPEEELEKQAENSFQNSSIFRRWNEFFDNTKG